MKNFVLLMLLSLLAFIQFGFQSLAEEQGIMLKGCVKSENGYICPESLDVKFSESQLLCYRYVDKSLMSSAKAYYGRALYYERKGNLDVARLYYIKAIKTCPFLVEAYINLGDVLICLGEYDEAIEVFLKVRHISSNYFALIYNNIGLAYEKKGEYNKAIEYYELSLNLDPKNIMAHINLATLYYKINQQKLAVEHWKTVNNISPQFLPVKLAKYIDEQKDF